MIDRKNGHMKNISSNIDDIDCFVASYADECGNLIIGELISLQLT